MRRIYLDHHATTPVDPRVLAAMLPFFTDRFGNSASRSHAFGWEAEEAVEAARAQVAHSIGATPEEIIFTSGATESDNLALRGVFEREAGRRSHLVVSAIEHPAVLEAAAHVERLGGRVTTVAVPSSGIVDPEAIEAAIEPSTALVSVMAANNEIGTIQPLAQIAAITAKRGVAFHTDAAQALGRIAFDVRTAGVDLASLSAHKIYGPKGVGALFVRCRGKRVRLNPQVDGGGQERGLRAGTLPVPLIVGFGAACAIAEDELPEESRRLRQLRDRLHHGLMDGLDDLQLNGDPERRLPGNLNLSFNWVEGESLIVGLKGIAVSSGSACSSKSNEPSHVLRAIGLSDDLAHTALRFGIGRFNTEAEIDEVIGEVIRVVNRLRDMSPIYELHKKGVDVRQAFG